MILVTKVACLTVEQAENMDRQGETGEKIVAVSRKKTLVEEGDVEMLRRC